ncbi:MAG: adenylate kinase [Bernardetiaceae bacterium]|nr:adenylate kinase [Bernardetiaceae bacterium]
MLNIIIFGPPGAGKGTQSEFLVKHYELVHISTGDLLRSAISQGTDLGKKAQVFIKEGALVPDEVVIGMIEDKLEQNVNVKGVIFDGFPRTIPQAEALDNLLANRNTPISGVVSLKVSEEELTARILERGKTSGRADDQNEETVKNRVKVYYENTAPVAGYYEKQGKLHEIDGIGSIQEISEQIKNTIDSFAS